MTPSRLVTSLPVTELPVADGNWDGSRASIHLLILHTMVGSIAGANARFNDPAAQVSAHYGVGLDGHLVHWVNENATAYHAGVYRVNQASIGIEHEDDGDYNGPRSPELYQASAALIRDICLFYALPIDADHIQPHRAIVATDCPDMLDVPRLIAAAAAPAGARFLVMVKMALRFRPALYAITLPVRYVQVGAVVAGTGAATGHWREVRVGTRTGWLLLSGLKAV